MLFSIQRASVMWASSSNLIVEEAVLHYKYVPNWMKDSEGNYDDEDTVNIDYYWTIEIDHSNLMDFIKKYGRCVIREGRGNDGETEEIRQWNSLPNILIYDDYIE